MSVRHLRHRDPAPAPAASRSHGLPRVLPSSRDRSAEQHPPPLHQPLSLAESPPGTSHAMAEFVRAQIFGTTFEITSRYCAPRFGCSLGIMADLAGFCG